MITVNIPTKLYDELKTICAIRGEDLDKTVQSLIEQDLACYRDDTGNINLKKAQYRIHSSPAEQKAIENERRVAFELHGASVDETPCVPAEEWVDCYYVKPTTLIGRPYAVILLDGQLVKAPADYVRLVEED